VVDGNAVAEGRFADDVEALKAQAEADPSLDHDNPLEEVFTDQLAAADLIVLNKTDLVEPASLGALRYQLTAQLRPGVKLISTRQGVVDPLVLLGLSAAAEDDLDARPSHHDLEGEHDHDDFESFAVAVPLLEDAVAWERKILQVLKDHDILRLKGFLALKDKDSRQVIQAVGARIERYFDRAWGQTEPRLGKVVVIGQKGLDRTAIEAGLQP
jgi:cobalamin biosynthesis protein CobW